MSNEPQLSVIQLTFADTTFEEDLALIAASGAGGIGVAEDKLRDGEDERHIAAFRASGLVAAGCVPTMPGHISPLPIASQGVFTAGAESVDDRVGAMCKSVERLAAFSPDSVAMITGSSEGYSRKDAWRLAVEGIREVGRVAAENSTRIALEPTRDDLGIDLSFLRSIPETIDFLDEVASPAVGLCYDLFHLWDTKDLLKHTERHADRIFSVQYCDARKPLRTGADRLVPGDGVVDIPGILGALERGGFNGWYECEIFSDDGRWGTELPDSLWKLPPSELLDRAHAGFREAWAARRETS